LHTRGSTSWLHHNQQVQQRKECEIVEKGEKNKKKHNGGVE